MTTGGRATKRSASRSASSCAKSISKSCRSSRSSSSGLTIWITYPSCAPRISKVSASTDCVAVTISPKWNSAATSAAASAPIFSAKSASVDPRRMRIGVFPSPCGITAPPNCGACILSNSSRNAFLDLGLRLLLLLAFFPNAPAVPPRPGPRFGAPPPGRCGPPVVGAPVDGPPER